MKGEALEDLLLDVREEFRHVVYDIHDPVFFRAMDQHTTGWFWLRQSSSNRRAPSGANLVVCGDAVMYPSL